jgi:hypothetical protein
MRRRFRRVRSSLLADWSPRRSISRLASSAALRPLALRGRRRIFAPPASPRFTSRWIATSRDGESCCLRRHPSRILKRDAPRYTSMRRVFSAMGLNRNIVRCFEYCTVIKRTRNVRPRRERQPDVRHITRLGQLMLKQFELIEKDESIGGQAPCASSTSSKLRKPWRGVLTSTAILPGLWRLVRISSCA